MDRTPEEIKHGIEAVSAEGPDEPFLMSKAEVLAQIEGLKGTGCGGYSTIGKTNGRRDVGWDYACKD